MTLPKDHPTPWLDIPLAAALPTRAAGRLADAGYTTLAEVARLSNQELLRLPGFSVTSLSQTRAAIKERRLAHAKALLDAGMTMAEAAEAMGVKHDTFLRWDLGESKERMRYRRRKVGENNS